MDKTIYNLSELAEGCETTEVDLLHRAASSEFQLAFHFDGMVAILEPGRDREFTRLPHDIAFIPEKTAVQFLTKDEVQVGIVQDVLGNSYSTLGNGSSQYSFDASVLQDGTFAGFAPHKVVVIDKELYKDLGPVPVSRRNLFVVAGVAERLMGIRPANEISGAKTLLTVVKEKNVTVNELFALAETGDITLWGLGKFMMRQSAEEYFQRQPVKVRGQYFIVRSEELRHSPPMACIPRTRIVRRGNDAMEFCNELKEDALRRAGQEPAPPIELTAEALFVMSKDLEKIRAKTGEQPVPTTNKRDEVHGLPKIAKRLGLTLNTVKNYLGQDPDGYGPGIPSFIKIINQIKRGKTTHYWAFGDDLDKWTPPPGKKKREKK